MILEVSWLIMKIKVTVRTIQQRMKVFHILLDLKAGPRDGIHDTILVFLVFCFSLSACMGNFEPPEKHEAITFTVIQT